MEEPARVVEAVEVPAVGPNDVRVEIRAASLCGSDLEVLTGDGPSRVEYPLIVGHEGAGVVDRVGDRVAHLSENDRVVIHYPTSCDRCQPCLSGNDNRCRHRESVGTHRDGTFAEYVTVPSRSVIKLGANVPFEWGSIAGCAVSTAYHAVRTGNVSHGDTVVVFGVGGVGLHAILWANFVGAGTIIAVDVADAKLPLARAFGADSTVNAADDDPLAIVDGLTDGWGADVALECSGASTALEQAVGAVNGENRYESGAIVSVGLQTEPLSARYWDLREGKLAVSGDHTRDELDRVLRLLRTETVDLSSSITHRFPLDEVFEAADLLIEGDEPVGRIALIP